ncbi:hypothetical protein BWI17_14790 [Betaproteobacteria bacterium GR16-43]|nr:hypothetical protein BWI17_14790 [Betaproteobacteria bacterium GR16-43]
MVKRDLAPNPVAIVGLAYRLPGAGGDSLWPALLEGRNLVTTVEASRWSQEAYHHPRKSEPGTSYSFAAGSIGDISGFDAGFFGISPREAVHMDPQQRILLELAWEAFESAGIKPSRIRGSNCGVYVGMSTVDYGYRLAYDLASMDATSATGSTASIAANRLSYFFDVHGPSMVVDTACSSSLVAFHQACQAIAIGEIGQALVGGISLHLHPYGFIAFSKASMLSRRGICSVFDAAGDGYVRSEGGGIFVLKNLEQAIADGNPILAVVAGTGVNAGGKASSLTVPNAEAQASLLGDIYRRAGIDPADVDYLEAHGTGTAVGDPIETRALGLALGRHRPREAPLPIGSVKSNLGHLEAAAGVAGLVKALLCLKHRAVPPTIHLDVPNPHIAFDDWNLKPVAETLSLHPYKKLVVGVNSFGFGGANAHAVLESPPSAPKSVEAAAGEVSILLSGHSDAALRANAALHARFLRSGERPSLADIAHTNLHHRDWHAHRALVSGTDRARIASSLAEFAEGRSLPEISQGRALPQASAPAFVYSGNGAQWIGMGADLLAREPAFRDAVARVDARFRRYDLPPVVELLSANAPATLFDRTEEAQRALFAVQVGTTELLRSWGIEPARVAGHSVGEIAAAWACGALDLEQAVEVIFHRSRFQGLTKGSGRMAAVGLSEEAAREWLVAQGLAHAITVACVNSPRHVTLAGPAAALAQLGKALAPQRVFFRQLDLDYAFHSATMDPVREGLLEALARLKPAPSRIPFHSAVTGEELAGTELGASYWWRNIREPVRFAACIRGLADAGLNVLLEVGPHPVLKNYMSDSLRSAGVEGRALATLQRSMAGPVAAREAFHQLVIAGCPVDLAKAFPRSGRLVELPPYPWQRERHWREPSPGAYDLLGQAMVHPLLGYRLHESAQHWENHLDVSLHPELADHVVGGAAVFPAAGFVEMALAASREVHGGEAHEVESLEIRNPLVFDEGASKTVRFCIESADGRFTIRSRVRASDDPWQLNAVGRLLGAPMAASAPPQRATPARKPDITDAKHYALARSVGLAYGPAFRSVAHIWLEPGEQYGAYARLATPQPIRHALGRSLLHPAYLDGCFQLLVDVLRDEIANPRGFAFLPVSVGRIRLHRAGSIATAGSVRITTRSGRSLAADFALYDGQGLLVAEAEGVRFRAVPLEHGRARPRYLAYRAVPAARPQDALEGAMPTLARLAATCAERLHPLTLGSARKRFYEELEPLSDVLCASFAERAVRQLAGNAPLIDPAALAAVVPASQRPLLHRTLQVLEEDQLIEPAEGGWRWSTAVDLPDAREGWITVLGDYPDEATQVMAWGRAGMHLPGVLAGREAAAESPDGGAISRLASGARAAAHAGHALAAAVAAMVARFPPDRAVRILEVTSCRSEITSRIVGAIDRDRCHYRLACTTDAALGDCAASFDANTNVSTCRIDLEAPHLGLKARLEGSYDLLVIPDGFMATADAPSALDQLAPLLGPEAVIALLAPQPSRALDLIFGADPSWWVQDREGATRSRLRTPREWESEFARHGFANAIAVPEMPDSDRGAYLLLAARSEAVEAALPAAPAQGTHLIVQDNEGYAAALGVCIEAWLDGREQRVAKFLPADFGASPLDTQARLAALLGEHGPFASVVFLSGLPGDRGPRNAEAAFEQEAARCAALTRLLIACRANGMTPSVFVVTAGATSPAKSPDGSEAVLWGFARTAANEFPELKVRLIDCTDPANLEGTSAGVAREILEPGADDEVVLAGAARYAMRLGPVPTPAVAHARDGEIARLDFTTPGTLRNLLWRSEPARRPGPGEVQIEVKAAGLNFRDVMYAMGLLSDEAVETGFAGPSLGMELSGVITAVGKEAHGLAVGDEVIAFAPGAFATRVVTPASIVAKKPAGWSFEAAATVPTVFFTVYYALKHLAQLREGEKLLVHGAAGGVGLAAIQMARWLGAEVFATAGTSEKRDLVRLLGADHVFDSRTLAFADEVLAVTGGVGVDVVLNSLSGEAIPRNLRALAHFGRFVELGKRDFYENTQIGMRPFRNNVSYFGVDADQLLREKPDLTRQLFGELMALFEQGVLTPLPYRAFPANEALDAFRYMQQSRQIGKVVLGFEDGVKSAVAPAARKGTLTLDGHDTYLVTGGLEGFGLRTAQWLVARGARHLVLVSRSGEPSLEARAILADLEALGARIRIAACDVTDRQALAALLASIPAGAPLRGIVHAAAVIQDGLIANLSESQLRNVLAPKMLGALHLDELTRKAKLDFFVLFSSATTLFGNPGQANYVAANAFLEALAVSRRHRRLPALCVSWGAIGDAGYLARNEKIREALTSHMGGAAMEAGAALDILEQLLLADASGLAVLDYGWRSLRRFLPASASPRFHEIGARGDTDTDDSERKHDLRRLAQELGPEEMAAVLTDLLKKEIAAILRLPAERLDAKQPLQDLGMDSLMGMELLTAVEARFGVNLPLLALSEGPSIDKLVARVVRALQDPAEAGDVEDARAAREQVSLVAAQYAPELDAAQIDELTRSGGAHDEAQSRS